MLNEADKKSIKENAQKALDILDDQVFGLSEQERYLFHRDSHNCRRGVSQIQSCNLLFFAIVRYKHVHGFE